MSRLRELSDRMDASDGEGDPWQVAIGALPELGLSKAVFIDLSQPGSILVRSNAGRIWTDTYTQSVRSGEDPFAVNCLTQVGPILTGIGHLEAHPDLDDHARALIAEGSETLDIRTGLSVTMCPNRKGEGIGWNLMSRHSVAEFADLRAQYEMDWRAWCQLTFAGLAMAEPPVTATILTPRERDCLAYFADGLRTADVAFRLGIVETTVEMHARNARERPGARTRDQAVAFAVRRGMI